MKPVFLCMIDRLTLKKVNSLNKVYLNNKDYTYSNIGLGENLVLEKDILNNKILIDNISNSSNIHIIGNINKDKDNLKNILNVCQKNKVYMHLFSNKKPSVKTLKKDLKIGKIINTIHDKLLEKDIDRVYNIILEGKDSKNISINKDDTIIFFNDDLGFISNFIDMIIAKEYKNILTIYPYKEAKCMHNINKKSLSESLNELGVKVLEDMNISYILDGYQKKDYKNISYTNNIFDENIDKYDIVISKLNKDDIDKVLNFDGTIILITKLSNKLALLTNGDINISDINELNKVIINLFKTKDNKYGFIFRVVSISFILFCIVYYMTRLLHFYIME